MLKKFTSGRKRQTLIGAALMLLGFTLAEISLAYHIDYSFAETVMYVILGMAVSIFGLVCFFIPGMSKKKHEMDYADKYFINVKAPKDKTATEKKITRFRRELADFFAADQKQENSPLQELTTQIYKNIADLQKNRLDHLGIKMHMVSERRKYSWDPIHKHTYFDGKYEISEVKEEIEAIRRYAKEEQTLLIKRDAQIAHYSLINARKIGDDKIICPNCGAETTRENLIDGCDYCNTKFNVEDLGEKISEFALRDNYETAYSKYKENRTEYANYAFIIIFIVLYLFFSFILTILMLYDDSSGAGSGDPTSPLFLLWGFAGVGASFSTIFAIPGMIFYAVVIFPIMEVVASKKYHNRKNLSRLKKEAKENQDIEQKIRKEDPLFSVGGFYSNVQNKIATVLFADDEKQINTFAETNLSGNLGKYRQVLDFDVDDIFLEDYRVENGEQIADVSAELSLVELKGRKAASRKEHMKIRVVKDAACKTKAVCEPYVMTCKSCGGSLSLVEGLVCANCGTRPELKKYDWTIRSI